jgi:signal transduction histidine kinase
MPMDAKRLDLYPGAKLTFFLLVGLIVGGNGLLIWQFHNGRLQAERVSRVSAQMAAVLRLQGDLLAFHEKLGELAQAKDALGLKTEIEASRDVLLEQVRQTKNALTPLSPGTKLDPQLLPTLDAIEIGLPSQLDSTAGLASSGDWSAISFRIDERLNPFENEASALVKIVDQNFAEELSRSHSNLESVQNRILVLVPATAIYTFVIAMLFSWTIARKFLNVRVEERVRERTRIARDLHDTLLQSFYGLLLQFQAVAYLLPGRPEEARKMLDGALDEAEDAINEGRDTVQGLRSSTIESNDIAEATRTMAEALATKETNQTTTVFRVEVEGKPRNLHPILRDEVYRIVGEALRNAFRHAQARQIEVEICYDDRQFRLRIKDDGKGIDPALLSGKGRAGHYGLNGMRERAKLAGGALAVRSELDSGTEVELTISAAVAYATSPRRFWWQEKASSKGTDGPMTRIKS